MKLCLDEKEYKWLEAAKCYELSLDSENSLLESSHVAESWRRIGFCYGRASRQAKHSKDFKKLMGKAVTAYNNATKIYDSLSGKDNLGKKQECLAMTEYLSSWLIHSPEEKRKALEKCWQLGKKLLPILKKSNEKNRYSEISNLLLMNSYDLAYLAQTVDDRRKAVQDGANVADEAISTLSDSDNIDDLILALAFGSILNGTLEDICDQEEERKIIVKKSLEYSKRANELSKKSENNYSKAISDWAAVFAMFYLSEKSELEQHPNYARDMLQNALILKDNFLIGYANLLLQDRSQEEDPRKLKQMCEEGIAYSKNAIKHLQLVGREIETTETYQYYIYYHFTLAKEIAVTVPEKTSLCQEALKIGKEGLRHALLSGSPTATDAVLHALTRLYTFYSSLETRKQLKQTLLRKALTFTTSRAEVLKKAYKSPVGFGINAVLKGQIIGDLALLEESKAKRIALLEDAISEIKPAVIKLRSYFRSNPMLMMVPTIARSEDTMGKLLDELYLLTEDKQSLKAAVEAYNSAANDFARVDLTNRVAESYWKSALDSDRLDSHQEAAETFQKAQASYETAAKKISQFSDFYSDYANYMKAWSEVELAKDAHNEEEYEISAQHYENVAKSLGQSKFFAHLSTNFYAWSLLEYAERLSREENNQGSSEAFSKAAMFFQESKKTLNTKLDSMDKPDERNFTGKLIKISDVREEYCKGRMLVEEAKILAKKGQRKASSRKYEEAATIFQDIGLSAPEQTAIDSKSLFYLCRAWQKMAEAEEQSAPALYREAAEFFRLASESAAAESTGLMALGHSAFCKSLEVGVEFETTRNVAKYEEAIKYIEAAAHYYLKAGYESASDYAKGTQQLFNAYVFMEYANKERDPGKQARYFSMAEKVLEVAKKVFEKTRYQDKTDQVQRVLQEVKEKRQLALSLHEIFHGETTVISSAESFSAISPNEEKAVGLERFEHAEIQSRIIQHETEAKMGDTVNLEIQIINVGKESVLITKIENMVLSGFQLVEKPNYFHIENTSLTTEGKRLDPLKTDEIKLSLRNLKKGCFEIKPLIVGIDQNGGRIVQSMEPVIFTFSGKVLPGRVPTGYAELDDLLFGGIPNCYSVMLAASPSDERELLIEKFLEIGARNGQSTFFITAETRNIANLVEEYPNSFYLFLCNTRADIMIKDSPNVSKIKGIENLTDIDVAVVRNLRILNPTQTGPKRACITLISDALLQHHAIITRKWLSGLLQDLKSKGFTTFGVVDPKMHSSEEVQAILSLFEGEIRIQERETDQGVENNLRIRKMYNQKYMESEILLTR